MGSILLKSVAIICKEITEENAAILHAERSKPEIEGDSGWQFTCGKKEENFESGKVWSIQEVINYDSSIKEFIELPIGTIISRPEYNKKWKVSNK